jgi:hypothetical protein
LEINEERISITKFYEKKITGKEVVSLGGIWVDDKLVFNDNLKYFIRDADRASLVFGELKGGTMDQVKWEAEFDRVL